MRKTCLLGVMALVALLQAGVVLAYKNEVIVKAETRDDFTAVNAAVHKEMQPGGRYDLISQGEREDVDTRLAHMQSLFDKYGTVAQMDQPSKIQLFNDQEAVNAALTRRDNKRLICERIAPVGSHIPRTFCQTYGEKMQSERDTLRHMDSWKTVPNLRTGH